MNNILYSYEWNECDIDLCDAVIVFGFVYNVVVFCTCAMPCKYRVDSVRVNSKFFVFVANLTSPGVKTLKKKKFEHFYVDFKTKKRPRDVT